MQKDKKLIFNIFKVSFSNFLMLISGLFSGFILPKIFSVSDYGVYKIFTLYLSYLGLLNLGFVEGVYLKYSGVEYSEINKPLFRCITKFFVTILLIATTILIIISLILFEADNRIIMMMLALMIIPKVLTNYYQTISQMTFRFNELSIRNILNAGCNIVSILILYIIFKKSNNELTYITYVIVTIVIQNLLLIWYIHTYREITFGVREKITLHLRDFCKYITNGIPLLIANLISIILFNIDRQFVSILYSLEIYAIYAFAYNIMNIINTGIAAISTVLFPSLKKRSDLDFLTKKFKTISFGVISLVAVLMSSCFVLPCVIERILPKYVDSVKYFVILLPALLMQSVVTIVSYNYLKVINKQRIMLKLSVIVLIISVFMNYLAYRLYNTPVAISVASVISSFIWMTISLASLKKFFKVSISIQIISVLVISVVFYIFSTRYIWYVGLILYIFFMMIYICGLWVFQKNKWK